MLDPRFHRIQRHRFAHEKPDRTFVLNVWAASLNENTRSVDLHLKSGPSLQGQSTGQQFVNKAAGSVDKKNMVRGLGAIRLLQSTAILALNLID